MDTHISTDTIVRVGDLVARAERGEEVVIERDGKPVARVVATERAETRETRRERWQQAFADLRRLREGTTTGGVGWKALRDEGRKW